MRDKIIHQANLLFRQYGIRSVTMDELAKSMAISKRTIYIHFTDKNTLIREVVTNEYSLKMEIFAHSMNSMNNVIEAIVEIIRVSTLENNAINPLYFKDLKRYHPDIFYGMCNKQKGINIGLNNQFVKKGIDQGMFRDNLDIEIVVSFLQVIANHIHNSVSEHGTSLPKIIQDGLFAYLFGIATEKGRRTINEHQNTLSQL